MRLSILAIALILFSLATHGQNLTQTLRGKVIDAHLKIPLAGASVVVLTVEPKLGIATASEGAFSLSNVPLGRHTIEVNHLGYESNILSNILVSSGKEVILEFELSASPNELSEVVVKARQRKDKPLNQLAMVSARSFTVEETQRYAGGVDDPARMATVFAGVSTGGNLQDNALTIRGNSPKSLSWRMEGIDIPNPNHFAGGNIAGGGMVSLLSGQMLANSDFFTGAFPAEYGNAIGGVFDIRMRTGNAKRRESTVGLSIMGIDISSEGPFVNGGNATYLFNYRYSTMGLLVATGIMPSEQIPRYQDLSFKLHFPTSGIGTFSLWGIGGLGYNNQPNQMDSTKWVTEWNRIHYDWDINPGAVGLNHRIATGTQTYLNTTLAASGVYNNWSFTRLDNNLLERKHMNQSMVSSRITLSSFLNHRVNQNITLRTGINYYQMFYNLSISSTLVEQLPETYTNLVDELGNTGLGEVYAQLQYKVLPNLTFNPGVYASYFVLNGRYSIEPRVSLKWDISSSHSLGLGYGLHSQLEELHLYFARVNGQKPNLNLDYTKSHHLVMSYDWLVSPNVRVKLEPYYQRIVNALGIADSSYSVINYRQQYVPNLTLQNNSEGRNVGVDVTIERFFNNNYYFLFTASVFDSKYKAADGIWRNTHYNKGRVLNLLFGKEFFFKKNTRVLGINVRSTYAAGTWRAPILKDESYAARDIVYDYSRVFEEQAPSDFQVDLNITFRMNKARYSGVWSFQLLNAAMNKVGRGNYFNRQTGQIEESGLGLLIPVVGYKVQF